MLLCGVCCCVGTVTVSDTLEPVPVAVNAAGVWTCYCGT